jgi:hypothetical protein
LIKLAKKLLKIIKTRKKKIIALQALVVAVQGVAALVIRKTNTKSLKNRKIVKEESIKEVTPKIRGKKQDQKVDHLLKSKIFKIVKCNQMKENLYSKK